MCSTLQGTIVARTPCSLFTSTVYSEYAPVTTSKIKIVPVLVEGSPDGPVGTDTDPGRCQYTFLIVGSYTPTEFSLSEIVYPMLYFVLILNSLISVAPN